MQHLKPLLTVALCLIVLATSVTQALARGQMATGRMVQLCAGGQVVSVMMDAQGNPVDRSHQCPDCLALTAALPPVSSSPHPKAGRWLRIAPSAQTRAPTQKARLARARAPPALI